MITVTNREEFIVAFGSAFEPENKIVVKGEIHLTDKDPIYSLNGVTIKSGGIYNLRWLQNLKGVTLCPDVSLSDLESMRCLGITNIPKGVSLHGCTALESLRCVTIEKDCHIDGLESLADVVGLTVRRNTVLNDLRSLKSLRGISLGSNVGLGALYNLWSLKGIRFLGKEQILTGVDTSLDSEVDLPPDVIMKWWFRPNYGQ